jgi:hypothetical protein
MALVCPSNVEGDESDNNYGNIDAKSISNMMDSLSVVEVVALLCTILLPCNNVGKFVSASLLL